MSKSEESIIRNVEDICNEAIIYFEESTEPAAMEALEYFKAIRLVNAFHEEKRVKEIVA